ncbi:MAG: hypothetical protein IPM39_29540 [Chloroflexi bacterium]|nr:hypothetical protein [Chloroflexota bacterium]
MSHKALTYWQGGIETTALTPIAATRRLYEIGEVPEEKREKEYVQQARQNFMQNFDVLETSAQTEFTLEAPALSFNDLAWWAELYFKGGVSPTGVGPYVRTYNGASTSDDLKTATLEVADGVGAFQIPGVMGSKLEIKGKNGSKPGPVSAKYDLIGQKVTPGHTMTAALSERDLVGTYMVAQHAQFFLNDSAGSIGTTELATLMEFSVKLDNKVETIFFGGDSLAYGGRRRDERYLEIMVKLLFDATSYSEFTSKFRTNAARYGQLKISNGANNIAAFNFHTKFDTFGWPEDGATRQVSLLGRSVYDATLGYDWQLALTNQLAAI